MEVLNKVKLGEILDVVRGASLSGEYYSTEGDLVRLTLGNFNYPCGGFKENTSKADIYFTGPIRKEFILNKGDIITPLTEQVAGLLGETARIPESGKYIQSGDVGKVVPNEEKLDDSFAYYLLSSPSVKLQLGAAAQQTKIRHTSPDKIKDCIVWLPSLDYQKKAGFILNRINATISNNNAISSTLESLAKTIYDYWFLQFEFPNEEGKPYKSSGGKMVWNEELKREIPEGWEAKAIGTLLSKVPKTVSVLRDDYTKGNRYPIVDQSKDYICGYTNDETKVLHLESCIVFGDHTNIAKFVNFPFARGADGTQIIISNERNLDNYLLYMQIQSLPVIEQGYSRHYKFLKEQFVFIPSKEVNETFCEITKYITSEFRNITESNNKLVSLRDFLLPMLMNGQVKVNV